MNRQPWHGDSVANHAQEYEERARNDEQPSRAVHQKKSQRAPAVSIGLEMRRMGGAPVSMERDRHFGDLLPVQAGFDNHLGGELHAGTAQIEAMEQGLRESSQAAIDIVDRGAKPTAGHDGEHGIAPPSMQKGHRARLNRATPPRQPTPHHKIVPLSQLVDEAAEIQKVVTVVGIAHDNVATSRCRNPPHERIAVPLRFHMHDSGSHESRNFL